jgi:hypothetical protein
VGFFGLRKTEPWVLQPTHISNANIGPIAYMIALSASMKVHNVFHVSLLKKYVSDPNHVIDWFVIQVEREGDFQVNRVRIMDQRVKVFRNKAIGMVKVRWICY